MVCSASEVTALWRYTNLFIVITIIVWLGEHPRFGALDVCPFIPVRNVTIDDCVACAREFAERLALEMHVPGEIDVLFTVK